MAGDDLLADWTNYVLAMARHVIESFGPRSPGSEGERQAQEFVGDQLRRSLGAAVRLESFAVAPQAFMGVPLITGWLLLAAIGSGWLSPWLAMGFSGTAALVFTVEFVFYRQLLDPLFPKRISSNVVGVQPPSGKVVRRVILNAHADAAYEWRWHYLFPKVFPLLIYYSLASLVVIFGTDVWTLIQGGQSEGQSEVRATLDVVRLAFLPGVLVGAFYTSFRHVSPGANDNLSGVFIVTGLARYLQQAGIRLENTELVYLITGSEEAGLRGAKAYAKRHKGEYQDVETILITLDTLRDLAHLHVYHRDCNGLVQHDREVCALLHDAGQRCGVELGYATVFLGSSDAAAFTEAGFRCAALCGMDPHPAGYYHNRRDRWDHMGEECIRKGCEIILDDRQGLASGRASV